MDCCTFERTSYNFLGICLIMFVPYVFSICFTPIIKKVMNVCVCVFFFQGRLVTFIIPHPRPTVLCFNPRGLEPHFPSYWEKSGDDFKSIATSSDHGGQCFF